MIYKIFQRELLIITQCNIKFSQNKDDIMISSVSSLNTPWAFALKKCTCGKKTLHASQVTLYVLTVISAGISIESTIKPSLSSWIYPVSYTTLGLSLLGIITTLACKSLGAVACRPQVSVSQEISLLSLENMPSLNLTSLIHELCEMSLDGTSKPCTTERVKEIVILLERSDNLNALNSIPEYYQNKQRSLLSLPSTFYTPLQYWASRGNLPVVEFLMQHGAVDYPTLPEDTNNGSQMTSALYAATMARHAPVVAYLLRHEAQPSIAFNQNLLSSFIPKLIFELCQGITFFAHIPTEKQVSFEGLELVLQHLASHQPDNLQLQLKVPICPEKNSLDWVETLNRGPEREQLLEILTRFGAVKGNALSHEELAVHGNIGPGFTLQEIASFKN